MDLSSRGSTISKTDIEDSFKVAELLERKIEFWENAKPKKDITENTSTINEEIEILDIEENEELELPKIKENPQELTIEDFLEDFKL